MIIIVYKNHLQREILYSIPIEKEILVLQYAIAVVSNIFGEENS